MDLIAEVAHAQLSVNKQTLQILLGFLEMDGDQVEKIFDSTWMELCPLADCVIILGSHRGARLARWHPQDGI